MAKVYVIITDGRSVLVASGGNSGDPPAPRRGLHLPGGTIDRGENAAVAAVRECGRKRASSSSRRRSSQRLQRPELAASRSL